MRLLSILIFLSFIHPLTGQVLIKNVNVVDVENKKILSGYNVLALDGKIISIDQRKTFKLPEGTQVIDATGKYLVPGYTDAHVHFFQSGGLYARPDAIDLRTLHPDGRIGSEPSMATPTHGKALFEAAVAELVPQVQAFRDEA